ncbi:MAG: 2,3-bisphosphoglycerate-independent phosphoglycerate mutase [Gammaproteobacteria bacterium]|nr:2,3-bisphosphoglycerate-independent phosphoglycerate mutase [Gammaproteobacteria bacterium]
MLQNRKGVIIVIDGLGDRPAEVLGGLTPLEAAKVRNFDTLASEGICGMVDPLVPGMPVGTHTGTSLLMGLAPKDAYKLARGPIEAIGIDLPIQPGDVTMRCNFATLEDEGGRLKVLDRRAGRISENTEDLAAGLHNIGLDHGIVTSLHPASQHRAVLRFSGPRLSAAITDTDPGDASTPGAKVLSCYATDADDSAMKTAGAVNQAIKEIFERIKDHPVNEQRRAHGLLPATGIITRGAGMLSEVHNFLRHLTLNVAVVASERTVLGLTKLFHFEPFTDPRFTAMPDTDLTAKVETVSTALENHDIVFLHIKGTDVYGHDRDPAAKKEMIERIDQAIAPLLDQDIVIGVSADHSTDSTVGRHCGDPVPSLIKSAHGRKDDCTGFGESQCMRGGMGRLGANGFLLSVLDYMGRLSNYTASDSLFVRRV